jgi:hypothetical protein
MTDAGSLAIYPGMAGAAVELAHTDRAGSFATGVLLQWTGHERHYNVGWNMLP